jgi:hypothetical protein
MLSNADTSIGALAVATPHAFLPLPVIQAAVWLVAVATLGAGAPAAAQTTTGDSFQWAGRIPAGATLRILTVDGEIAVSPATGDQAEVRGQRRNNRYNGSSERALVFQMLKDGDNVTVCAYDPDGGSCNTDDVSGGSHHGHWHQTGHADFTVTIPAGVRLVARSGDGRVDIRGAAGGAEVAASTGDGEIMVEGATGPVRASTGDGRITIGTSVGPVNASTGDGSVEVRVASLPQPQDMKITTGDGSITLYLPSSFGGQLEAHTGDGHIESDFPLQVSGRLDTGHLRATLGAGGPTRIELSTGDGDVHLRQSR